MPQEKPTAAAAATEEAAPATEEAAAAPAAAPAAAVTPVKLPASCKHAVKEGDTLFTLSKKYGVSVEQLAKLNKLTNKDLIKAGEFASLVMYTPGPPPPLLPRPAAGALPLCKTVLTNCSHLPPCHHHHCRLLSEGVLSIPAEGRLRLMAPFRLTAAAPYRISGAPLSPPSRLECTLDLF